MNLDIPYFPTIEIFQALPSPKPVGVFDFIIGHWELLSGAATLLILFLQLCAMWRQANIARRQVDISEKQTSIAEKQSAIAEKQATLEHQNYMATHRARVIVRRVSLDVGSIQNPPPEGVAWKIQYVIANTGASEATIVEGNATAKVINGELPAIPPFDDATDLAKGTKLVSGYNPSMVLHLDEAQITYVRQCFMTNNPGSLYFFGFIQYQDGMGIIRRTAFCRKFDAVTRRFKPVDDLDYEYVE